MKCKNHTTDLTSTIGVCASCLREHLHTLLLAQTQSQTQTQNRNNTNYPNPYPKFPRSVSPSIHNQNSNNFSNNKPRLNHSLSDQQRFYNSPHIVTVNNTKGCIGTNSSNNKKKSFIRFSSFSNLFRSNTEGADANSNHRRSVSTSGEPSGAAGKPTSVTSSPLWLSNTDRKNKAIHVNDSSFVSGFVRKQQRRRCVRDRGMSPVRNSDDENSDGTDDESSESCRRTPMKTPVRRGGGGGGGGQRSVTEMIFCLSPLVRASPNRLWSMKGKPPVDGGDGRFSGVPHISDVKSFCANRSRKLADFGRGGRNR